MNQRDRARLGRLYGAVSAVPFPHDGCGTQTASVRGMVSYQADMRQVVPMLQDCILAIARPDDSGSDPDEDLDRLEAFIEKRRTVDWRPA